MGGMLSREASDLLISIGSAVEGWVLDHARSQRAEDGVIGANEIRESLRAFSRTGIEQLEQVLSRQEQETKRSPTLRAG